MKRCSKCRQDKSISEFRRNKNGADGLTSWCKPCCMASEARWREGNRQHIRQRNKAWATDNRERVLTRGREYYAERSADPEYRAAERARAAEYRAANPEKVKQLNAKGRFQLYGMTEDSFLALFSDQGGSCRICASEDPKSKNWHIDHDHGCCPGRRSCGSCVRAILCGLCNAGLGQFRDSPDVLRRAADYLDGWNDYLNKARGAQ